MESGTLKNIDAISEEDKNWAMYAHLCMFVGYLIPFANFIGPLVILLTRGKQSRFVAKHANTILNFQLTVLIVMAIASVVAVPVVVLLSLATLGIFPLITGIILAALIGVASTVFAIIGAIRAREGKEYTYPCALPLLK